MLVNLKQTIKKKNLFDPQFVVQINAIEEIICVFKLPKTLEAFLRVHIIVGFFFILKYTFIYINDKYVGYTHGSYLYNVPASPSDDRHSYPHVLVVNSMT